MTKQEYTDWANKILELLPEAKAVAVDWTNLIFWYRDVPRFSTDSGRWVTDSNVAFLMERTIDFPWQESLVTKRWRPEVGDE